MMNTKFIFLSKRARNYILEAVEFLTTRVKITDIYDYKKLVRAVKYTRGGGEAETPLTLKSDNEHVMKWWIDILFSVHPYIK